MREKTHTERLEGTFYRDFGIFLQALYIRIYRDVESFNCCI